MAIPTQFSVTSTRTSPISNPALPQDPPQSADAENVSIVDGASVLPALSVGDINAPSEASALPSAAIDTPNEYTAESVVILDTPTAANSESAAAIDTPSEATAEAVAVTDTPTAANVLPSADINTPSARSAESAILPDTPTEATAESSASIDAPSAASVLPAATIATPSEATAEPAATATAPSTLTATAGTPTTPTFPLNHARILYDNKLEQYISVSENFTTGTALNALKPNTFERWSFTGNNSIIIDVTNDTEIDTICIGGHNFAGAVVRVYYTVNSGEFLLESFAPETNDPLMAHSSNLLDVDSIRVEIEGSGARFAAYISAGVALQMQRPFFNGHTPITDADITNYYHNKTESGNIIGQAIRAQGYKTSYEWQNIDDAWYRQYFAPFKQAVKTKPFFIAWNLLEYPLDVGFGRVAQDISASMQNGTVTKRGGLSFELLGF